MLLAASAPPVRAGRLEGSLATREPASGTRRADPTEAFVWVESIPERTERDLARGPRRGWFRRRVPPPAPVLTQVGLRFSPSVLAVVAGRSLQVHNQDSVWHGVFSVTPTHAFDLGKRPPGRVDTLRFAMPGIVLLRCDIHPDMSATILVTPNHAWTRPDSAGRWRLPNLPRGRYVVRAWAPGRDEIRREVAVPRWGTAQVALRW